MSRPRKRHREAVNLTPEEASWVRGRVSVLVQPDRSILDLICDGYVQGMSDAMNHLEQKNGRI